MNLPSTGKRGDEHAGRHNHDNTGRAVLLRVTSGTDGGKDGQPGSLPESSDEEGPATTKLLDDVQSIQGHEHIDSTEDELHQDGIIDTSGLEDGLLQLVAAFTQGRHSLECSLTAP